MLQTRVLTSSYWTAEPGEVVGISVCDALYEAARTVPDRLALVDCVPDPAARRSWTYAEFVRESEQVARALLAEYEPGDRIAIWAPNSAQWVILQQAISFAGMVMVALNPAYRSRELTFVLEQSQAVAIFCVRDYRGFDMRALISELRPQLPGLRGVHYLEDWDEFLHSGPAPNGRSRRSPRTT